MVVTIRCLTGSSKAKKEPIKHFNRLRGQRLEGPADHRCRACRFGDEVTGRVGRTETKFPPDIDGRRDLKITTERAVFVIWSVCLASSKSSRV